MAGVAVCLVALVMGFNACHEAFNRVTGKQGHDIPQPVITQRAVSFATEHELKRVEARIETLEQSQKEILTKLDHDKTEIMAAAQNGRQNIYRMIDDVSKTCSQTAGKVDAMAENLRELIKKAMS